MYLRAILVTSSFAILMETGCLLDSGVYPTGGTGGNQGGQAGTSGAGGSQGGFGGQGGGGADGGTGGNGGSTNTGGQAGSGGTGGTGGSGGTAGSGGTGGMAGQGGQGGSGGGDPCMDAPEADALTINCTMSCLKILMTDGGMIVPAESSADDDQCETKQPFVTHPLTGQAVLVWVNDPGGNDTFTGTSLGSYPTDCFVKCGVAPAGLAPDNGEMETELFNGGYTMVSCGSAPTVSLAQSCSDGMYSVLQY